MSKFRKVRLVKEYSVDSLDLRCWLGDSKMPLSQCEEMLEGLDNVSVIEAITDEDNQLVTEYWEVEKAGVWVRLPYDYTKESYS